MLNPSDYLLIYPEDVGGRIASCMYVRVLWSSTNYTMTGPMDASDESDECMQKIFTLVAERRVVSKAEAERGTGLMMRQAVVGVVNGVFKMGQVVSASEDGVDILCDGRAVSIELDSLKRVVPDIVGMLMARQPEIVAGWSDQDLIVAVDEIDHVLERCASDTARTTPPTVAEIMKEVPGGLPISDNTVIMWIDALSGASVCTTIGHAVRFEYARRSGTLASAIRQGHVGRSIGDDPGSPNGLPQRHKRPLEEEKEECPRQTRRARLPRSEGDGEDLFFGELLDRDRVNEQVEMARRNTEPRAPGTVGAGDQSGRSERERLAALNGDPDLLRAYFAAHPVAAATRSDSPAVKPARTDFRPHATRITAHKSITSSAYQGTSPMDFCVLVAADERLLFRRSPTVVTRLYDLDFGTNALSIMHFATFTYEADMAAHEGSASANSSDFSGGTPIQRAAMPSSWDDLTNATVNFSEYARRMCDPITIDVALAVERLVREQRTFNLWRAEELSTLIYWIDTTLGRFHHAVMRDALNQGCERVEGPLWITESNSRYQRIRAGVLDKRYCALGNSTAGRLSIGKDSAAPKKMSPEVMAAVPRRGAKQLCVKYLSAAGCKGRGDGVSCGRVHERPKTINKIVGDFVNDNLGGLHPSVKIE